MFNHHLVLSFLFIIISVIVVIITSSSSPVVTVQAVLSDPRVLQFRPTDVSNFAAPASDDITHLGQRTMGVPLSAYTTSCGNDPIGNYSDPSAYFELSFEMNNPYVYRLATYAHAPNELTNSYWVFQTLASNPIWRSSPYDEQFYIDITPTSDGSFIGNQHICMYLSMANPTVGWGNHTLRFRPREVGALFSRVTLTMQDPPKITRIFSLCEGESCDLSQPIPIRIVMETGACMVKASSTTFGQIVIEGAGGTSNCDPSNQVKLPHSGEYSLDCLVPTAVTANAPDQLRASFKWPTSSLMPTPQGKVAIAVQQAHSDVDLVIIIPAAVGGLLLLIVGYLFLKKYLATRNAPKEEDAFASMFVNARNVSLLQEKTSQENCKSALKIYDKIVRSATSSHNCYMARQIGESYLVVAKEPAMLFRASAQIHSELSQTNWYKMLTGKDAVRIPAKHSSLRAHHHLHSQAHLTSGQLNESGLIRGSPHRTRHNSHSQGTPNKVGDLNRGSYSAGDLDLEGNISWGDNDSSAGRNSEGNPGVIPKYQQQPMTPSGDISNNSFGDSGRSDVRKSSVGLEHSGGGLVVNSSAASSSAEKSNHSRTTRSVLETGITCSIAVTYGKGKISVEEGDSWIHPADYDYFGDVVDEAAYIVDFAHPRQTLTLRSVELVCTSKNHQRKEESDNNDSNSNKLDDEEILDKLHGKFCALGSKLLKGKTYRFVQFDPRGLDVLDCGLQDASENADSIQAQLDAASGGFAQKIISLLYLEIHGLSEQAIGEDDRKSFLDKYKALYVPVMDAIKHTGGTLVNVTSSNLVIAFNAFTPSPMHATRAANCLFQLREVFTTTSIISNFNLTQLGFCGGLVTGQCVVGTLESDKSHKQVFGAAWHQAQELMRLARPYSLDGRLTCPCFAVWNARSDLNNHAQLQFVDIVSTKSVSGNVAFVIKRNTTASNNNNNDISGIVSLMRPPRSGMDDEHEWMYDLQQQEMNNPYRETNAAYVNIISDFVTDAEDAWNAILKMKLETNQNGEVQKLQMVGLEQLKEILDDGNAGGWISYCTKVLKIKSKQQQQQHRLQNEYQTPSQDPNLQPNAQTVARRQSTDVLIGELQ